MLKQSLEQRLQQKLSPQQIQLMKLVQLPTLAFEDRVQQELEENPALEDANTQEDEYDEFDTNKDENLDYENDYDEQSIDTSEVNIDEYLSDDEIPSYKTDTNNYSQDDDEKSVPFAQGISFNEHLVRQLHTFTLTDDEFFLADYIIGNLDESGYLRRSLSDMVDDLVFTQNVSTTEEILEDLLVNYVQKLDPTGVGARDLKECLILQLENKTQTPAIEMAIDILNDSFERFTKKHYKKIIQKHDITEEELKDAIHEIERLNPKPGKSFGGNNRIVEHIIPDFTIRIHQGQLELTLNGRNAPELRISRQYSEMLDTYKNTEKKSKEQEKAVLFVKQKLDAAKWFVDAVKQRQNTLYKTMSAIMEMQKEYFLTGDETNIKPMILKDIAEKIEMDISTVSRVANSKYVDTPYGTFLIKSLFSESLTNEEGEEISTREIKRILQNIIDKEDKRKPLTDEKLAKALKDEGYSIARRTVAKYREQLNIPVGRLRKEI